MLLKSSAECTSLLGFEGTNEKFLMPDLIQWTFLWDDKDTEGRINLT